MEVNLSPIAPLFKQKEKLLHKLGLNCTEIYKLFGSEINTELLTFLRILNMEEQDFSSNKLNYYYAAVHAPMRFDNEIAALNMLIDLINYKLALYPTTLEHDIELLESNPPPNIALAIQYRMIKKRILKRHLDFVHTFLPCCQYLNTLWSSTKKPTKDGSGYAERKHKTSYYDATAYIAKVTKFAQQQGKN